MSGKLSHFEYLTPRTIAEACALLTKYQGKASIKAGGTDLLVSMKGKEITPQYVVDIKSIPDMDYIKSAGREGVRIGALATMSAIESSPIIKEGFSVLASAASQMGSATIRNMETIGGNLGRAAPSADTAPALIGLGARVKTVSSRGERTIGLEKFFLGPGKTALQSDELITEIQIPATAPNTRGIYLKMPAGKRTGIAVVGIAAIVTLDTTNKNLTEVKIVLGAVAPTPIRAITAEEVIKGKAIDGQLIARAAKAASEEAKPISDIRASASYRKEMVKVLTAQALTQLTTSSQ